MASHALEQLVHLEASQKLQILELSNGINTVDDSYSESRTSDASNASDKANTPASLAADLVHYKELFSKLRFSYLEQATKEKFLRAITAETPLFVEPADNAALEAQLAAEKLALQAQKAELARLTDQVQSKGRELARRYEALRGQKTLLETLPLQIADAESLAAQLRESHPPPSRDLPAHLTLPLPATLALLADRRAHLARTRERIAAVRDEALPRARGELEGVERELRGLAERKEGAVERAREARRRAEGGGGEAAEVERRGRWCRAGEGLMREILEGAA